MISILQNQFDSFRKLVDQNITTIRALLEQVDQLSKLSENISEDSARVQLDTIRGTLTAKIDELVDTTTKLFEVYRDSLKK